MVPKYDFSSILKIFVHKSSKTSRVGGARGGLVALNTQLLFCLNVITFLIQGCHVWWLFLAVIKADLRVCQVFIGNMSLMRYLFSPWILMGTFRFESYWIMAFCRKMCLLTNVWWYDLPEVKYAIEEWILLTVHWQ